MNTNLHDNRLISGYHNIQNNVPFGNNVLLNNNQLFANNINQLNSQQIQQIQMMQMANMQRVKEMQKTKQIERMNELENNIDKEKIKESVIKPIKIEMTKQERDKIENQLRNMETQYKIDKNTNTNKELMNLWKQRTNQPYKNIIKNDDYKKRDKVRQRFNCS